MKILSMKHTLIYCIEWWVALFDALDAEREEIRKQAGVITPFEAQRGER